MKKTFVILSALVAGWAVPDRLSAQLTTTEYPFVGGTWFTDMSGNLVTGYTADAWEDMPKDRESYFIYNTATNTYTDMTSVLPNRPTAIDGNHLAGAYDYATGVANTPLYYYDGSSLLTFDAPAGATGDIDVGGLYGNTIVGSVSLDTGIFGFTLDVTNGNYTILNHPGAVYGTSFTGIYGNNLIGYYNDVNDTALGFTYDLTTGVFTNLDVPADLYTNFKPTDIDGNMVVGNYTAIMGYDGDGIEITETRQFVYNIATGEYQYFDVYLGDHPGGATIDNPGDEIGTFPVFDDAVTGISGTTITGNIDIGNNMGEVDTESHDSVGFVTDIAAVPEPSGALLLMVAGLVGIVRRRRSPR